MPQQSGHESGRSVLPVVVGNQELRERVIAQLAALGKRLNPAFDEDAFREACNGD